MGISIYFRRQKHEEKQQAKRDREITARESVAKTMNGIVVQAGDGSWAIVPEGDWMGMRKYDAGRRLDESERAIELATRGVVAATVKGVVVQDRSGYWGILPENDWIMMSKSDASWSEMRKYDRLFNGED